MEFKWGALIAALLVLSVLVSAIPSDIRTDVTAQLLTGASVEAQCRADFVNGYVSAIVSDYPNASSLGSLGSKVESDSAQLATIAASGDADSYRSFRAGSFDADIQAAHDQIDASKPWKGGDNATLASLQSTYQQLQQTYQSCDLTALKAYANARVSAWNDYINAYANQSNALATRGDDISSITAVLNGATPAVIAPLQSAISAATNGSQITAAFQQYCLFDGCANGYNYHLEAKYQVARMGVVLNAAIARVNSNSSLSQYASDFSQAQTDYASVQSSLSAVGTAAYSGDEQSSITDGLRTVNKDIQSALQEMRQSMMAARIAARGNRTGFGNGTGRFGNRSFNGTRPFGLRGNFGGRGLPANASDNGSN